jgi:phospholipid/cholesterol/gamma-HCH transport system permease protein
MKMTTNDIAKISSTDNGFLCEGKWSILHLDQLNSTLQKLSLPEEQKLTLDGSKLLEFDSSGALVLTHFIEKLKTKDNEVQLEGFHEEHRDLLKLIEQQEINLDLPPVVVDQTNVFAMIGEETIYKAKQADEFIILLGNLTIQFIQAFSKFKRFQFPSIVSVIYSAGLTALPILGLLSFLIGLVLAYETGLQLKNYGATIFIANLSGTAIFREFGPLITAIIVAGRTSSSFTAQIGSMVVNEEVDALEAMGLSPVELLVMPKVIGLLFIFPLLVFWSDIFSVCGAMFMSKSVLEVDYLDFLNRLRETVGIEQFKLGLYKAPTFAMIIALVGCFQGFRVQGSTDSIGYQTTKSVVQALFLIIVADAIYSIIYNWLEL